MKILVTGGAGFIGSNLVKYLIERGDEVKVLDNLLRGNKLDNETLKKIQLIKGDIRDYSTVKNAVEGCDIVYHLAAVLGVDIVADNPIETMDVEVIGMKNVVDASILYGIEKIIYASTSGVYGKSAMNSAVTENVEISPKSSYAIAKRFNEIYLMSVKQEKGLDSISCRFFNVYGYKQDERMVIPRFVNQTINESAITVYGTGNQTRDFTFIDDVVKSLVGLADKVSGCEIFNISRGKENSINELANTIKSLLNSKSKIEKLNSPEERYDFEVEKRWGSAEKLFKAIEYKPDTDLLTGLSKTYGHLFKK